MTEQQIQIKVAESLGWIETPDGYYIKDHPLNQKYPKDFKYTTSLDACREFERDAPDEYWNQLMDVTHCTMHSSPGSMLIMFAKATPLQRCEAWLRYMGQWVGSA